jgi:hypothetical protein
MVEPKTKSKAKRILEKWQKELELENWYIRIIWEKDEIMNEAWNKSHKRKNRGAITGDVVCDPIGRRGFIRINEDYIDWKNVETVLLHELLHIRIIEDNEPENDREWIVDNLTEVLLNGESKL